MSDKTIYTVHPKTGKFVTAEDLVDVDMDYREPTMAEIEGDAVSVEHIIPASLRINGYRSEAPERRLFHRLAQLIDLLLEPESAESAIANLDELYRRRLATNLGHAKRWLIAQVIWIVYGRAMELLSKFSAARAGK